MFKTLPAIALAQISAAAFTADFMSGVQTGVQITDLEMFEEYSCAEPELAPKIEQMMGMYNMAKTMMKPKHKSSFLCED